jgi:hypothetical protein
MKKLLLSLVALLVTVGAWAQSEPVLADGVYTIQADENGKRGYLAATAGYDRPVLTGITWDTWAANGVADADVLKNSKNWYVSTKNGVTYLYNVAKGKFIYDNGTDDIYFGEPFALHVTKHNNYIHVGSGTGKRYLSMGCGTTAPNQVKWETTNGNDGGCLLTFTLVESGTETFKAQIDAAKAALSETFSFNYISGGTNPTNTWSDELNVYPAGLSNETPCEGDKGNSAQHIGVNDHTVHKAVTAVTAVGGDLTVNFQYDSSLGNHSHAISILGVDAVNSNGEVVASDYHYGFSGTNSYSNTYTLSSLPVNGNYILRYYVCKKADDHSLEETSGTITVSGARKINDANIVSRMLTTLKGKIPTAKGKELGCYDEDETKVAEDLAKEAVSGNDVASYVNAFVALDDAIDGITFYTPTPGNYYRLISAATTSSRGKNVTMVANRETNKVTWKEYGDEPNFNADIENLWQFVDAGDGKYNLKAANGGYLANVQGGSTPTSLVDDVNSAGDYSFGIYSAGVCKLYRGSQLADHLWADGNNIICGWEAGAASNSAWYIVPATNIDVVVNEYASIYLPFAVKVEGAQAYAIESTNTTHAVLTEKADIPAAQGAILAGNGTATLNIVAAASSDWTNNKLNGSTVNTYVDKEAYVLAKKDGVIGFYKAELNQLENTSFLNNANKAYLEVETADARFLSFDFGTETAIEGIEAETATDAVVYDLAGRRVKAAQKGLYIVNGKVVIK